MLAAQTQVNALRSAGLTPDPLVVQLSEARPIEAAEQQGADSEG